MSLQRGSGQKRFFYHYNKQAKRMTVHWEGQCLPADDITVLVPTESKHNQRQPRVVMQGWANGVTAYPHPDDHGKTRVEVW